MQQPYRTLLTFPNLSVTGNEFFRDYLKKNEMAVNSDRHPGRGGVLYLNALNLTFLQSRLKSRFYESLKFRYINFLLNLESAYLGFTSSLIFWMLSSRMRLMC